jgi:hypothetical protein
MRRQDATDRRIRPLPRLTSTSCALRLARSALLAIPVAAGAAPLNRPAEPVVLTGAAVPALVGVSPGDVVAFRWDGAWAQIPVQVDERAVIDLNQPFGSYTCTGSQYCFGLPSPGLLALQYTDPTTYAGADPTPTFDADDEIVFMAKDMGDLPDPFVEPPGVVAGSGVGVHATDPLDGGEGWVYLFRQTGGLDPGAGVTYVHYDFQLLSGPYLATYQRAGGPNPEDSSATSGFYTRHFADRWLDDALAITAGGATGVDVLDRRMVNVFGCVRSEDTFDAGEGCFVANTSGPVRAIRSYMGANSGPHTQRLHLFYERREDVQTSVRVHSIPGALFFVDYSPAATGMVYRNDNNPAGVTIDGVPDTVTPGSFTWETVDGPQGGLTMLTVVDSNIPGLNYTSSYADQSGAAQCTGDSSTYGASGLWLTGTLPATDVPPYQLTVTQVTYFEAPGDADGPARRAQLDNPLSVMVTALGGAPGTPLAGAKLVLGTPANPAGKKLVLLSRDPAVAMAGDPTEAGGTLRVAGVGFDDTYELPAGGWTALNGGSGWRYRDRTLVAGPIKLVVVKPGKLLKVAGKGATLGHSLGQNPQPVDVVLTVAAQGSCLRFGGTGSFTINRRFKATGATAPGSCS